jgi:hypothetical protein
MAIQFDSPGAAAGRALREVLLQQQIKRQQDFLDGITLQSRLRAEARAEAEARRQAVLDRRADADRTAQIFGPDADLTPEAAATLRAGGYQVNEQTTLPARTIAMPTTPADVRAEVDRRKAALGYPTVAAQDLPSTSYSRRQETYAEQLAREQREAAQAEKDEQRRFRDEQADAERAFRGEQAEANRAATAERSAADRDLKLMIAQMSASNNMETRALGLELKRLQIQAERDKQDAARIDRERSEKARAQGRSDVRDLAQGLINDPNLERITGNVGATTPDLRPGSIDARARLTQLVNKLSLEGRNALKGQGAISDFEGRMLAAAVTSIDPRAGAETVRKHLKAIVAVMSDGEPAGNGPGVGERRMINGQLGEWDGRGWLPVGGGR